MATRTSRSIAFGIAALLLGALVTPIANADDPLGPIRGAVNRDRTRTSCPAFVYSQQLEDLAQTAIRYGDTRGGDYSSYHGKATLALGSGDPQAAAINDAYKQDAAGLISNCAYTEFGVGFSRDDRLEYDQVSILFGMPAKAAASPAPADPTLTPTPAAQQCPAGSPTPTVPAFGTCAPVPPPTDKVRVSFAKGPVWTVTVTNAANIAGKCTFTPNGLGGGLSNKSFDIAANGTTSFQVVSPLAFVTYHVVTSCHGTFNGKDVEFGHDEQDVTA